MLIARNLESKERNIDLVETFNYLIGLTIIKAMRLFHMMRIFPQAITVLLLPHLKPEVLINLKQSKEPLRTVTKHWLYGVK